MGAEEARSAGDYRSAHADLPLSMVDGSPKRTCAARRASPDQALCYPAPRPHRGSAQLAGAVLGCRRLATTGKEVVGVPLTKEQKTEIVGAHGRDTKDTGSTRVQIALLTQRITELTEHMKVHQHDHHSRRGLLKLVGRRRRLLTYMRKHDLEGYRALIKELGLRR
jgi:small subunit ribosomal protein S15